MATSSPARLSYRVITSHPGILSVSVSAGNLAAVGGLGEAAVYDINSGDRVQRLEPPAGVKKWRPISVTFTPTCVFVGNRASVGEGGGIYSFPTTDLTSRGELLDLSPAPECERLEEIAVCVTPAGAQYLAVLLWGDRESRGHGSLSVYRETSAGVWTSTTRDTVSLYWPRRVDICPDLVVVTHAIQQQQGQGQDDQYAVTAWEPDTLRRLWSRHGDSQLRAPHAVCIDPDTRRVLVADGCYWSLTVQVTVLRGSDGTVLAVIPLPGGRGRDRDRGRGLSALGVAGAGRRLLAADGWSDELVEVTGWTDLLPPLSPQEQLLPPLSPQEQLTDLTKAKEKLEEDLSRIKKENLEITKHSKTINDDLINANKKIADLKTENAAANEQSAKLKTESAAANKQITDLKTENAAANKQITYLKTENTTAYKQITNLKTENTTAYKQITDLKTENSAANKQITYLKTENAAAKKQITDLKTENTDADKKIAELKTENNDANKQIVNLKTENIAANKQIADLKTENTTANKQIINLKAENAAANRQITELKTENATANKQIIDLKTENADANKQITELKTESAAANKQNTDLKTEYTAANKQITDLKAEILKLEKEKHDFYDLRNSMTRRHEIEISQLQEEMNKLRVKAALGDKERHILKKNRTLLVENLQPEHIIDYLLQEGVLLDEDRELIASKPTTRQKSQTLLDILPYRGPLALRVFRDSLKKDYSFILEQLDKT